jgi:hypothetical protein
LSTALNRGGQPYVVIGTSAKELLRDDGSLDVNAVYPERIRYAGQWVRSAAMGTAMVIVPTCRGVPSRQRTIEETVQLMCTGAGGKDLDV